MADVVDRENGLLTLAGKVVHDSEKLIAQQAGLLRAELRQEFHRLSTAAFSIIVGVGLGTAAVFFFGMMFAHLFHTITPLPLWCGYAVVGGVVAIVGALLVRSGRRELAEVRPIFPQSEEAFKENMTWLKDQVKAPGS